MVYTDPYTPDANKRVYECRACGHREKTTTSLGYCPKCHGAVLNIGVARE